MLLAQLRLRGSRKFATSSAVRPTISAAQFKCVVDKLCMGTNSIEFCIDPNADHSGIVMAQSDYVNEWLASKSNGSAVTSSCPSDEEPADLACDPLLPND